MGLNRWLTNLLITTILTLSILFPFSILITACSTDGSSSLSQELAEKLRGDPK